MKMLGMVQKKKDCIEPSNTALLLSHLFQFWGFEATSRQRFLLAAQFGESLDIFHDIFPDTFLPQISPQHM